MALTIIFFIAVFLVGIAGGYLITLILNKFPEKLKLHMDEMEEINKSQLYPDIIKEDYSLSYLGRNTLYLLSITLFTSIFEAIIFRVSKSNLTFFSDYFLLLSFIMVLRLPLLIELFIRSNRHEKSGILKRMTQSLGIMYRTYIFRIRPFLYGVTIIPLLIALLI